MINAIGLLGGILMILALKLNCQEILMAARRVVKYFLEIHLKYWDIWKFGIFSFHILIPKIWDVYPQSFNSFIYN